MSDETKVEVVEEVAEVTEEVAVTTETNTLPSKGADQDVPEMFKQVVSAFKAKLLPTWVRTVEQAVIIAQYAYELGLNSPLSSFKMFYLVNNVPTLTAGGLGSLIKAKGHSYRVVKYAEPVLDETGKKVDLITEIECFRKGETIGQKISFTWSDAVAAGLTTKPGPWKQYPKDMLFNRCLARASRIVYPDVIQGFYLAEEIADNVELPKDVLIAE